MQRTTQQGLEEFILAWNQSGSMIEVAQRLNVPASVVYGRRDKLKKLGVSLKPIQNKPVFDTNRLQELANLGK